MSETSLVSLVIGLISIVASVLTQWRGWKDIAPKIEALGEALKNKIDVSEYRVKVSELHGANNELRMKVALQEQTNATQAEQIAKLERRLDAAEAKQ